MKEEYTVEDYGIFSDSISITQSLRNQVTDFKTELSNVQTTLNDDSVFMGPVADLCVTMATQLSDNFQIVLDNFQKINDYLTVTSVNYQAGDTAASATLQLDGVGAVATDYANPAGLSGYRLDFVNSIKDGAVDAYNKYGVLPSLTLAQAILESGWGQSSIGNNIFGIKAGSGWTGKVQNCQTGEQNPDGSRYTITAAFRDYDSVADSIVDHAELLTTDRYQPVINSKNYRDACVAVKQCGYATSLSYSDNLINLIETYGLDQWDPQV